jgi:hypothetical protein
MQELTVAMHLNALRTLRNSARAWTSQRQMLQLQESVAALAESAPNAQQGSRKIHTHSHSRSANNAMIILAHAILREMILQHTRHAHMILKAIGIGQI